MKHTELPWKVYRGPDLFRQEHYVIRCGDQIFAAVDDKEKAAFIVHAVNNHYKLVEALEEIANSKYCVYADGVFISDHDSGYKMGVADGHRYCARIAKEALASATGGGDGS